MRHRLWSFADVRIASSLSRSDSLISLLIYDKS